MSEAVLNVIGGVLCVLLAGLTGWMFRMDRLVTRISQSLEHLTGDFRTSTEKRYDDIVRLYELHREDEKQLSAVMTLLKELQVRVDYLEKRFQHDDDRAHKD